MPGTLPVSGGTSEGNIFPAIKEFTAGGTGGGTCRKGKQTSNQVILAVWWCWMEVNAGAKAKWPQQGKGESSVKATSEGSPKLAKRSCREKERSRSVLDRRSLEYQGKQCRMAGPRRWMACGDRRKTRAQVRKAKWAIARTLLLVWGLAENAQSFKLGCDTVRFTVWKATH